MFQTLENATSRFGAEAAAELKGLQQLQTDWNDVFFVLSALQKAHEIVLRYAGGKIVWLLDRFDAACTRLDAQVLNSLRNLRDQFRGRLCYLVATRHPLNRLRNPTEIDEFYEIVAANTCWVGPMVERDALWIAHQMEERLNANFSHAEITQLIEVTGGLPAFMKEGSIALASGDLKSAVSAQDWSQSLLARPEFQRNCREIWDDLLQEEQLYLQSIAHYIALEGEGSQSPNKASDYLLRSGLLANSDSLNTTVIFSPIFAQYILERTGSNRLQGISLHPKTRAVVRDGVPLGEELTNHEDRLLSYFLDHVDEVCTKDALMNTVWPDDQVLAGIRDDRLAQLIKRLRDKIEPEPSNPVYIHTVRGRGYRFVQGNPTDDV